MRRALILLLAAAVLTGCAVGGETSPAGEAYTVYYLDTGANRSGDAIRASAELLELPEDAAVAEKAEAVVRRLLEGSQEDAELVSPVPADVHLLGLDVRDKRAIVDLSAAFDRLGGVELMLADYCLVLSLTALEGINSVTVTSQGRSILQQPRQVLFEWDVRLLSMEDMMQTVEVTLYFRDQTGALAGERRLLEIYEGQALAETLVTELLSGPENRELTAVIPKETVVTSVRVEAGVCYVNFLASSLESLPAEKETQEMILWSLAESLYSLDSVQEIRILADGQELELFGQIPAALVMARAQG